MGPVERAIKARYKAPPVTLYTYPQHKRFELSEIDGQGIVLILGDNDKHVPLRWYPCLEGVPAFLRTRGWIPVGGTKTKDGLPGTLDEYLKSNCTTTLVSGWLTVVLAESGVVEVRKERPLRVRLRPGFEAQGA